MCTSLASVTLIYLLYTLGKYKSRLKQWWFASRSNWPDVKNRKGELYLHVLMTQVANRPLKKHWNKENEWNLKNEQRILQGCYWPKKGPRVIYLHCQRSPKTRSLLADIKPSLFRKKAKYQMIHEVVDKGPSRFLLPQKTPTFCLIHIHISFSRCRYQVEVMTFGIMIFCAQNTYSFTRLTLFK